MKMHKMVRKAGTVVSIAAVSSMVFATTVFAQGVPVIGGLNSGWWSAQVLQNVGTANATVSATAYEIEGGTQQKDVSNLATLAQGAGVTILPAVIAGSGPAVEDIATGSMVISSDQPIVATVALTNEPIAGVPSLGTSGGTSAGVYEGTGSAATAETLNFPIAKRDNFGFSTVYFIQNAGAADADVSVAFSWNGGSETLNFSGIDPNRSIAVTAPTTMPTSEVGSAVVTSTNGQKLAGAFLEIESTAVTSANHKAGRALVPSDGDDVMFVPAFKKGFGVPANTMAISVQGDAGVTGTIEYTCADGACTVGETVSVPFNTNTFVAWPYNPDHSGLPDNSLYSAKITVTGGNAVATVGETGALVSAVNESIFVAIPESQATGESFCPAVKTQYFGSTGSAVVFPTSYPAVVDVEFTVIGSEDGSNVGNTYTIQDYNIASGSATFYDTANGTVPSTGVTWAGGNVLPNNTLTAVRVVSKNNTNFVVTSNEALHFTSSSTLDSRQYNCFGQ